jgi:hypothetical protein
MASTGDCLAESVDNDSRTHSTENRFLGTDFITKRSTKDPLRTVASRSGFFRALLSLSRAVVDRSADRTLRLIRSD